MLKIKEQTFVFPFNVPFLEDHALPLSPLDTDRNLNTTIRYLRIYTATTTTTMIKNLFDRGFNMFQII